MNISNILSAAIRSLRTDMKSTLINVAGLGTGLTVFILIVIYVQSQFSFNTHIPNADELFRLERGFHGITNAFESEPLASAIPEISEHCRATHLPGTVFYRPDSGSAARRAPVKGIAADSSFIKMFAIEVTEKSVESLLTSPATIIISRNIAEILFGDKPATGEMISFDNRHNILVEGVFEPLPHTSTMDIDVILPIEYLALESGDPYYLDNTGIWRYETYFRLDPLTRETVLAKLQNEIFMLYEGSGIFTRENIVAELRPLKDIYFSTVADVLHRDGDKRNTHIFIIIAGFVLIIAAINFINLSTAQSARRSKETGLRKILGSGRNSLILQICIEGVITILISVLLALAISEMLLPWYSEFVNINLSIEYTVLNLLILFIVSPLLLGALSGLLPAFYLSRVSPLSVLRKEMSTGKGGTGLRNFLTVFQFSISIFLITGTLIVNKQLNFINSYNPGYETENIIEVKLNDQINERFDVFKETSLSNPSIRGITRINQPLYQAANVWSVYHGDKNFTWPFIQVDEDFVTVFSLNITAGEDFSESMLQRGEMVFLVNEAVTSAFETTDILSETINNHEIVGVVNNFHSASLRSEIMPVTIVLSPSSARAFAYIKTDPENPQLSLDILKDTWNELSPDYPFEYEPLSDKIISAYISEKRFGELFTYFSFVSILISCLGLFALSSYTTASRVKEIAIRKVHGATSYGIGLLLSSGLTIKVLVSNLVAWPAAWFFMNKWLENFAYRIDQGILEFLLAAIIAQIIALATVSWHVYTTSLRNPAEILKYE